MIKLIKKHGLGDVIDKGDAFLEDSVGNYGKLAVQIADPTGITGWKDFSDSAKDLSEGFSWGKLGSMSLATLGVIPIVGGASRSAGIIRKGTKGVSEASKFTKSAKAFLPEEIFKRLVDPNDLNTLMLGKTFSKSLIKSAIEIVDKEILKVYQWADSKSMKTLPKKLQDKVNKLLEKKKILTITEPNPMVTQIEKFLYAIQGLEKQKATADKATAAKLERNINLLKKKTEIFTRTWENLLKEIQLQFV